MEYDRLGRKRVPNQERGLRPLHPVLPTDWTSKAIRLAMSADDWARFEDLVRRTTEESQSDSQARAQGLVVSRLLDAAQARSESGRLDWLDWERQKTLRLIRPAV